MPIPAAIGATANIWAPALLSLLGGRIGSGANYGRMKEMREALMRAYDPEVIGAEANKFFDIFRNSPAYAGARSTAMGQAQSLGNRLNASFYRRGLGTSGIAAVATPLAQSSFGQTFANIDANLFQTALQQAMDSLKAKAGIYERTMQPSIGAGTMGSFLSQYGPYLYDILKNLKFGGGRNMGPGVPAGPSGGYA